MKITLGFYKGVILTILFVVAAGFFISAEPNNALAQTTPDCSDPAQDCAAVEVAEDGKALNDISGLETCAVSTGSIISFSCGDKITAETNITGIKSRVGVSVQPTVGDILKCKGSTLGAIDCVLTKPDGSYIGYHTPIEGYGTTQIRNHAPGGQIQGSTEEGVGEKAVASVTGQASDLITRALQTVGIAILGISTFLLGMAGVFFNLVVVKTVFGFATLIGNAPGLLVAWGVLRDLGNMLLLFGFIFIGLATILDLQTYSAKKALPRLLIFAILMNFSLFAAEAIIDVSNVLSSTLYAQANTDPCLGESEETIQVSSSGGGFDGASDELKESCLLNYGLAGAIMEASGLSTMFQLPDDASFSSVAVYIGLSLFATIGAVVFFAAGIMLVVRALILTILMITAPIGFAAMALPPLKKFGDEWWSKLIHQAFFAPILILLILVSIKVSESFAGGNENGLAGALTQPNSSAMGVILVFSLVIGLLISSLMAAKKFGAMGADFAISSSKKFVNAPFSFAGRNTIGRGGAWGQKKYETWMGKSGDQQSRGGKAARFLLRNNVLGLDAAVAGATGKAQKARFGGSTSFDESKKRREERDKTFKSAREKADADARKAQTQRDLDEALKLPPGQDRDDRVAQILERMSAKEIEELDALKKSGANLETLAKNLSPEKFAALVKDGNSLTEGQRKQARDARFKDLNTEVQRNKEILADPNATQQQKDDAKKAIATRLKSYSSKDIENMSPDLLSEQSVLDSLTGGQREDLIKSNKLNPSLTRELKRRDPVEQIKSEFAANSGNPVAQGAVAGRVAGLKPKQVAKLSDEILTNAQVMAILSPSMLNAINDAGDISPAARDAIRTGLSIRKLVDPSIKNYLETTPGGALWV